MDNERDWRNASPEELKVRQGMIRTVTVELLRGGQPRPYADHEYEAYITFSVPEGQVWGSREEHHIDTVKSYVKLMIHNFFDNPRQWHEPWLAKLEQVEPGKWYVLVKSPFID